MHCAHHSVLTAGKCTLVQMSSRVSDGEVRLKVQNWRSHRRFLWPANIGVLEDGAATAAGWINSKPIW